MKRHLTRTLTTAVAICSLLANAANACTGITLKAKDGAVVFGRTLEWGSFDLHSRVVIVPRGHVFKALTPDGSAGRTWTAAYGAVGLDAVEKDFIVDGMNEKGLSVNVFYHPGYAEYPAYDPAKASTSMGSLDVAQYLLTTTTTVEEARKAIAGIQVIGIVEPSIGVAPPIHLMVTEPSGKAIVIEFVKGGVQVHDAPLGVITNSPTYDWHLTNLRNYINLSAVALPSKKVEDLNFAPLGGGSGMIGLPGDFTPPSRFVRAVAFSKTARPTASGAETTYEVFRILDGFNVPLGAAEGEGASKIQGLRSATLWTTAYDTRNLVMQYHTMHNRRVRQIDLKQIDFATQRQLVRLPLDQDKSQDVLDVTPRR
ncbi:MAG: choloylglycine hydrolase family protein [Betaproteobacteria bacterium]|nr:choloylglycine hydrolase family protein [Betaproteobacteria bacterium]